MLREIESSVFRTESIKFRPGLNVVLGDENATNSIGKSTLLMVIDFGFGGSALLQHNTDLVQELGHHDYVFTFTFDGVDYRFRRGTFEPDIVYRVNDENEHESILSLEEYTAFLKNAYGIDLDDISLRALISLYIRVWGKENLNVHRPLHVVPAQSAKECIENLIKTFGLYREIREAAEFLASVEARRAALKAAVRNEIVPKIGRRHYDENESRIRELEAELNDIRANLAKYATNLSEVVNREVLQLKVQRDELTELRLRLAGKLARTQKNITGNRHIKSKHFESLRQFVTPINEERLVKIEEFHSELARLLRTELREAEQQLKGQIASIDEAVATIDSQMSAALGSVKEPSVLVDRVYKLATSLRDARKENEYFNTEQELQATSRALKERLVEQKAKVLNTIEHALNDGIRRIVTRAFGPERKSPHITLAENRYSYTIFEDTGTGTAYAGLIVLDLTVFQLTALPIIVHDSLLFKNIENDSVSRLIQIYDQIKKQSFVSIDEIGKYGVSTSDLLRGRSVIQLDNEHVLYVKDWRRKSVRTSSAGE